MTDLTQKEKDIFNYISECVEKNGYAPSVRDICAAVGIKSTSSVHGYLHRLENKGYIKNPRVRAVRFLSRAQPAAITAK